MFNGQQLPNPPPQQLNLIETEALTELCHVAEAVVPHPTNAEYKLKRIFVDTTGAPRDPSSVPILSPHEHINFCYQAQRFNIEATRPVVPVCVTGFDGLKQRFDEQNKALAEQEAALQSISDRLARDSLSFRQACRDRLRKLSESTTKTEAVLLRVFRTLETNFMMQAIYHRQTANGQSQVGAILDELAAVRRLMRTENLRARVLRLEQILKERCMPQRNPEAVAETQEDIDKKRELLCRSRQLIQETRVMMEAIERDVAIMRPGQLETSSINAQ